jgi:hypothetical protein
VPKKAPLRRSRKHNDLQAQAQAVFDPAPVQAAEALSPPSAATDVPGDDTVPHRADEDTATQVARELPAA